MEDNKYDDYDENLAIVEDEILVTNGPAKTIDELNNEFIVKELSKLSFTHDKVSLPYFRMNQYKVELLPLRIHLRILSQNKKPN